MEKKRTYKLKIGDYESRMNMVNALAKNGYKVWIEEYKEEPWNAPFFIVCYELTCEGEEEFFWQD
jgi:hypothetical protein